MYFDDEFIKAVPDDPREAIVFVCKRFSDRLNQIKQGTNQRYQFALEGYAFLDVLLQVKGFPSEKSKITGNKEQDEKTIREYVNKLRTDMETKIHRSSFDDYKKTYAIKLDTAFHYEFSEGDLKKMQELLNELRDLISESQELAEDHRNRLLKKLERLQSELHKKVSDLDRFWGFFIDASIVVGLMGENAKPMVEVIQKIVKIIWPTQTRAYELPSDLPFKLLGQAEDDKIEDEKP